MHAEVVIRHAASNQLQRNAPHCKPPAAPKRPPDRRQTAPAPACAYPALRLAITDEASPLALRSTRNRMRTAVRRGAASCRAVLRSCSVAAVVRGVLACVVTAELSGVAERHRCGNPSGIWASQPAVAVAVAVGAVRTPDTPLVALSASAVRRADVRPLVGRTSGVHATGVHATGAIRVSGWTRVRCPRPLRPRCPTGLDPGIGSAGQLTFGRIECDVSLGPRAAWSSLPNLGLAGKDGRALAVRGSHEGRRQTWAAAAHAHRLRRRARHLADQGVSLAPGCRRLAENHEKEQVLTSPRRCVLSKLPAWCPTHRLTGVATTLRGPCAVLVPCRPAPEGPIRFGGGVRLRPQRGRGT